MLLEMKLDKINKKGKFNIKRMNKKKTTISDLFPSNETKTSSLYLLILNCPHLIENNPKEIGINFRLMNTFITKQYFPCIIIINIFTGIIFSITNIP